jgi:site-specific recombinase XerD
VGSAIHPTLEGFDADLARQGKSVATRRGYLADLCGFARWLRQTYGEQLDPARLVRQDVRAYKSDLLTVRKLKPATVNRKLTSLGAFCRWAVAEGLLDEDPTAGVESVAQGRTPPRALDAADLNRLIRRAQQGGNLLHIAVVTVLAHTGLRASELCALEMDDVEMTRKNGTLTVRRGKGDVYREVPLNREARRSLREYLEARPANGSDHVFVGQRGLLTASGVWRIVKKYARQAGLENASPHTLRHTFCTRLLREAEVDVVTVADLMGHADLRTTMRYTRPNQADREEAVEALV